MGRRLLADKVSIEIVHSDISNFLSEICENGIVLKDLQKTDVLTLRAIIEGVHYPRLLTITERKGGKVRILKRSGLLQRMKGIVKRPVLLFGIALILFLSAWLPSKILFISIQGNTSVPSNLILEYAQANGICFGANRRTIRNETVKNSLLDQIPQLQWVGVNTKGCVAEILVTERETEPKRNRYTGVCSIVALRDGTITHCTATRGNLLCQPGQTVKEGQTLISGFTDVGLCVRATSADGEVFATTERELCLVMPVSCTEKGPVERQVRKISLLFGKKRIKLYNECGILGGLCDRMYTVKYLTLPGGFRLPLGIAAETFLVYSSPKIAISPGNMKTLAKEAAESYLLSQMISGQIIRDMVNIQNEETVLSLTCRYICTEMIGKIKQEEILTDYGENRRKDR